MFSLVGILSLGGLFSAFVLCHMSVSEIQSDNAEDFRKYVMRTMLAVNLLVQLIIFIFGDIPFRLQADYSRYLVPASVWIIPLFCSSLDGEEKLPHIRRIVFYLCLGIFVMNGLFNQGSFLNNQNFGQPYDGISYDNPHMADDLQTAVEYIRVHEYTCGYAFAGEANTLVELMNGFPVCALRRTPDGALEYANWLTRNSYKTVPAEGAFFLMTEKDEPNYADVLAESGAERIYFDDEGYVIYDITDLPRFREQIREPEK